MRYLLEIGYNGKQYHGWQKQPHTTTVQGKLDFCLSKLLHAEVESTAGGRTDTGVHCRRQFVHFDTEKTDLGRDFLHKLNSFLPHDIAVYRLFVVPVTYHARFDATHRSYRYFIDLQKDALCYENAWYFRKRLDVPLMQQAADILKTYRDFEALSKLHTDVHTFNCAITHAQWYSPEPGKLYFEVTANRFLRGMVRTIVGLLTKIGTGELSLAQFEAILQSKQRNHAIAIAPANGLVLWEIGYDLSGFTEKTDS